MVVETAWCVQKAPICFQLKSAKCESHSMWFTALSYLLIEPFSDPSATYKEGFWKRRLVRVINKNSLILIYIDFSQ